MSDGSFRLGRHEAAETDPSLPHADVEAFDDSPAEETSENLRRLANELSAVRLAPADGFRERLRRELEYVSRTQLRPSSSRLGVRRVVARVSALPAVPLRPVFAAVAFLLVVALAPHLSRSGPVSAAEVLTRAEHAISALVSPDELIFRKWRIVERFQDRPGAPERTATRYLVEWMDGADLRRATGQSLDASGHMYLAYVRDVLDGRLVPRVYYEPGYAGEAEGLVSLVPDRHQFEAAALRFQGAEHALLAAYLAGGNAPYEPVTTEIRANHLALNQSRSDASPVASMRLSLEPSTTSQGRTMYRVRLVEPLRVQFRWASQGPPKVWLERRDTVRYISADTYLMVKMETIQQDEFGRRIVAERDVVEMRVIQADTLDHDPFKLKVMDGVPVRQQSAEEHLTQVLTAMQRSAAFERQLVGHSTILPAHAR